jgi:ribosomal protein L31
MKKGSKPKAAFATEGEARTIADSMTARDGAVMNTYVCGECHQFHNGRAR